MTDPRSAFEVPAGIYALSHSVGCLPASAAEALEAAYLRPWRQAGGAAWDNWLGAADRFREALAGLFGGKSDEFCPQQSVSDGFFNLLTALPGRSGATVLMHRDAFPSLGFVVHGLAAQGFVLRLEDGDPTDLATWERALNEEVDVVLVTHAHSNTGRLSPVAKIASLCRERGIISLVDIAQSAGVIPVPLESWKADAVIGSCVKWLCGGPGAGFLWASPDFLPRLDPLRLGWFSHEAPFEFDIENFRPAASAQKFWGGTPSIAPYILASCGIAEISHIGIDRVRQHNLDLIRACLRAAGQDAGAIDPATQSATLCLDVPDKAIASAERRLASIGCHHDRRGSVLRLSFHVYNTGEEAERVGEALAPVFAAG